MNIAFSFWILFLVKIIEHVKKNKFDKFLEYDTKFKQETYHNYFLKKII